MDDQHQRTRDRWDELAATIATAIEAGRDLTGLVAVLESAIGLPVLEGTDPDPWVTGRRFARVHAEVLRAHCLDPGVASAADEVAVRLLSDPPTVAPSSPEARLARLRPVTW